MDPKLKFYKSVTIPVVQGCLCSLMKKHSKLISKLHHKQYNIIQLEHF